MYIDKYIDKEKILTAISCHIEDEMKLIQFFPVIYFMLQKRVAIKVLWGRSLYRICV